MSKNINQIFIANPATSMLATDLFYLGRSPYGASGDFGILWSNVMSSITTVGTIVGGTWNGTVIAGQYGGTGVANTGKTITLGGNLTTTGAFNPTLAFSAGNTYTFPSASQTLLGLAGGTMTGDLILNTSTPSTALQAASKGYVDTTVANYLPLAGGTMLGDLILAGAPTTDLMAATKLYVDQQIAGTSISVDAASTVNFTSVYSNGAAGIGATLTAPGVGVVTLDGINTVAGNNYLFKNQTDPIENGVYLCTVQGTVGVIAVFTRATNYDTPAEINGIGIIIISNGDTQAGQGWVQVNTIAAIGTDDLDYIKFGNSGTVTSVGLSMPSIFSVSGSPITSSGTLTATLNTEAANLIFAGPTTGAAAIPTFRSLVTEDLPTTIYGVSFPGAGVITTAGTITTTGNFVCDETATIDTVNAVELNGGSGTIGTNVLRFDAVDGATIDTNVLNPLALDHIFVAGVRLEDDVTDGTSVESNIIRTNIIELPNTAPEDGIAINTVSSIEGVTDEPLTITATGTGYVEIDGTRFTQIAAGLKFITNVDVIEAAQSVSAPTFTSSSGDVIIIGSSSGNVKNEKSASGITNSTITGNTSNTASSQALNLIRVAGSTAGDAFQTYTVTGLQSYSEGIDNSDSDAYVSSLGTALGTTNFRRVTSAGEINYPLQPAFLAYINAEISNVTGNGDDYGPVPFETEIYDQNGDYAATGIFTASVSGRNYFTTVLRFTLGATIPTAASLRLSTSNRVYELYVTPNTTLAPLLNMYCGNTFADMDAGDTASIFIQISGNSKTCDLLGLNSGALRCFFSGKLAA